MNTTGTPTAEALERTLRETLQPTLLTVIDESAAHAGHSGANGLGYGTHFRVRMASPAFEGLGRVAAHRLVYDVLRPYIDAGLHALAIEIER
jgi:BolA protein